MKRTVIDGEVFIVRSCKDCPFLGMGDDVFCNHFDSEIRGCWGGDMREAMDEYCPLEDYEGDCEKELRELEELRKTELLPCPYCDAPARLEHYLEGWNVYCDNPGVCGIRTGWIRGGGERAIEMWNRRVNG